MTDETTPQSDRPEKPREEKTYTPPTLHAVDMRKDRHGLKYPTVLGTARADKDGYGQLMRMQANTVSGFHNIMTPQKLKDTRAKYRSDLKDAQQGRDDHERD